MVLEYSLAFAYWWVEKRIPIQKTGQALPLTCENCENCIMLEFNSIDGLIAVGPIGPTVSWQTVLTCSHSELLLI